MSIPQILALSLVEIVGDFGFKTYANKGGLIPLMTGIGGYIGIAVLLVISLQGSTILMVNGAWDGISALLESLAAYVFLGERLHNYLQYVGLVLITSGVYLLKIPMSKKHPFYIPKI